MCPSLTRAMVPVVDAGPCRPLVKLGLASRSAAVCIFVIALTSPLMLRPTDRASPNRSFVLTTHFHRLGGAAFGDVSLRWVPQVEVAVTEDYRTRLRFECNYMRQKNQARVTQASTQFGIRNGVLSYTSPFLAAGAAAAARSYLVFFGRHFSSRGYRCRMLARCWPSCCSLCGLHCVARARPFQPKTLHCVGSMPL